MINKKCCVLSCKRNAVVILVYVGGFNTPFCSVHYEKHKANEVLYYNKSYMNKHKTSKYEIMI